jgi:hypothetical protein
MNWSPTIKNGELLSAAEAAAFDVLITSDQNIPFQQNLVERKLALVIISSNIWKIVRSHAASVAEAVDRTKPGRFEVVEIPLPKRPPKHSSRV